MRRMREIPCPSNNEGCKYAPGCFLSEHHIWPKRTAENRLQRAFGNLAINKVMACRNIHDALDDFPEPPYPDETTMRTVFAEERGREFQDG
jgi:hypothetical protein